MFFSSSYSSIYPAIVPREFRYSLSCTTRNRCSCAKSIEKYSLVKNSSFTDFPHFSVFGGYKISPKHPPVTRFTRARDRRRKTAFDLALDVASSSFGRNGGRTSPLDTSKGLESSPYSYVASIVRLSFNVFSPGFFFLKDKCVSQQQPAVRKICSYTYTHIRALYIYT